MHLRRIFLALALLASGCAGPAAAPMGTADTVEQVIDAPRPLTVHITAARLAASSVPRAMDAARGAARWLDAAYGPWHRDTVEVRLAAQAWNAPPRARTVEAAAVATMAGAYWDQVLPAGDERERRLAAGLAAFSRDRIIQQNFPEGRAYDARYFHGRFAWPIRGFLVQGIPADEDRVALALHTLERHIGWPALQLALSDYARAASTGRQDPAVLFAALSDAAGRDLSWLLEDAFFGSSRVDYAVGAFASTPNPDGPGFVTRVEWRRLGDMAYPGTGRPARGPYQSGRGVDVRVTFADGATIDESWDGRDPAETATYVSEAPAIRAEVDPDRRLLLDVDLANNAADLVAPSGDLPERWTLQWLAWLQDAMVSYAGLL